METQGISHQGRVYTPAYGGGVYVGLFSSCQPRTASSVLCMYIFFPTAEADVLVSLSEVGLTTLHDILMAKLPTDEFQLLRTRLNVQAAYSYNP